MRDIIKLMSAWFKLSKDVPFGSILLKSSWLTSQDPFSKGLDGWQ